MGKSVVGKKAVEEGRRRRGVGAEAEAEAETGSAADLVGLGHALVPGLGRGPEGREAEHEPGEPDDRKEVDREAGALRGRDGGGTSSGCGRGRCVGQAAGAKAKARHVGEIRAEHWALSHSGPRREEEGRAADDEQAYQDGDDELADGDRLGKWGRARSQRIFVCLVDPISARGRTD